MLALSLEYFLVYILFMSLVCRRDIYSEIEETLHSQSVRQKEPCDVNISIYFLGVFSSTSPLISPFYDVTRLILCLIHKREYLEKSLLALLLSKIKFFFENVCQGITSCFKCISYYPLKLHQFFSSFLCKIEDYD